MEKEEAIQTMASLGLTVLQAKVYLTLVCSGPSSGRTAANLAKIASNDVYRVLDELQEKGLVEKIIAKPTAYKAIEIENGLSLLLQNKKEEYVQTEKKAKILSETIGKNNNVAPKALEQLTVTSHEKSLAKLHERLSNNAAESIDFICPLKMSTNKLFEFFPYLKLACNRGIKVRVITVADKRNLETPVFSSSFFESRFLPDNSLFGLHIFDKRILTTAITEKSVPSLFTDNAHIVKLAETYFNAIWVNARPLAVITTR